VGGGYAAAEESVFLTKFARHVTILVRKSDFSCAASVAEQAKRHEKITVLTNTVMEEVSGEGGLTYARYKNTVTGEVTEFRSEDTFGVFVFAGYAPATEAVRGIVELNEQGYLITDSAQKTSAEGVYGAGDVCIKPLRQVVTATADGALAATELEKYVAEMQRKTGLRPQFSPPTEQNTSGPSETDSLFTPQQQDQLATVFGRMEQPLLLKLCLDDSPVSTELKEFITALVALTEKLRMELCDRQEAHTPCVEICRADGTPTGLAFHGVPGGHEFTSFVLGLYNAAGPGQAIDDDLRQKIAAISHPLDIKILVTLSCTMCPDLVVAAQRIAAEHPNVRAHVYDLRHFDDLKQRYNVMSVPCMIVNDEKVFFGKKNLSQILSLLE
jgi:thioredoxin reductase (NADPH)